MMRGRKRSRCWELSMGTGCGTVLGEVIDWEKSIVYPIIQHWWLGMGVCTTDRFNRGGSHQCSYRYINRGKNTPVAWLSVNFVGWLFWHRSPNYELRAARAKATLQCIGPFHVSSHLQTVGVNDSPNLFSRLFTSIS